MALDTDFVDEVLDTLTDPTCFHADVEACLEDVELVVVLVADLPAYEACAYCDSRNKFLVPRAGTDDWYCPACIRELTDPES